MSSFNLIDAKKMIETAFRPFRASTGKSKLRKMISNSALHGKLYELTCLAYLIEELETQYGYIVMPTHNSINFMDGQKSIDKTQPHFEIYIPKKDSPIYRIFMNIEFLTLGYHAIQKNGIPSCLSYYHELDIVVLKEDISDGERPKHYEIYLAVECKSTQNFGKKIIKEILGIRREMGLLLPKTKSKIAKQAPNKLHKFSKIDTQSEYWLAYCCDKGNNYKMSPELYGIEFKHWKP